MPITKRHGAARGLKPRTALLMRSMAGMTSQAAALMRPTATALHCAAMAMAGLMPQVALMRPMAALMRPMVALMRPMARHCAAMGLTPRKPRRGAVAA